MTTPSHYSSTVLSRTLATRARSIRLPLQMSERRLLLFVGDVAALLLALAIGILVWAYVRPTFISLSYALLIHYGAWLIAFPTIWLFALTCAGGYSLKIAADVYSTSKRLVFVFVIFVIGYLTFFFLSANENTYYTFSPLGDFRALRILPAVFAVSAFGIELAWRWGYATQLTKGQFQRRLLIVGAGAAGHIFLNAYEAESISINYHIVGAVDDDPAKLHLQIAGFEVLGNHEALINIALSERVDEIVLAINEDLSGSMFQAIMDCFERGIQITPMPVMYEALTGRVPVEHVGQHWYVSLPVGAMPASRLYNTITRLSDLFIGSLGMLVLALVIPLIWLGNRIWSPGPLFYSQVRVGSAGRHYKIVKFRSMVPDAEKASGAVWASDRDPRITSFGNLLRKSRLDELPQFWNVLRGEMALIGPRPERPEFVEQLAEQIPFYRSRHAVKPGLTGWAQVRYRYGASVEDALIKLQYDLYYIKHRSIWLNILIIFKTIWVVAGFQGR